MRFSFKSLLAVGLAGALAAVSCGKYDDSELRDKISSIEERLSRLEQLMQTANQNIASLQTLTAVLNDAVFVTEITELSDGYQIKFSNGKTVTLKNGADGHTPAIGVKKDADGVYYWTIDGEWLLDASGNKVRVTGEDGAPGADGVTPQLKITDGWWYVSTDGGATWTKLGEATTGGGGDSFFKEVTYDDEYVYITLTDGTVLKFKREPVEPVDPPVPVEGLLSGTIIGTAETIDYSTGKKSTTVNTVQNAFDGDFDTFFASYERSRTWAGLDLGEPYVITKVGCSPRISHESRVVLGLFEGANQPDFSDALPLAIVKEAGTDREMQYFEVPCTRGFRYVRYVGPNDVRCNVAELEFYGIKGEGDDTKLYQLTNLPTVVINTAGAQDIVSKTEEIPSMVYIISEEGTNLLAAAETPVGASPRSLTGSSSPKRRARWALRHRLRNGPSSTTMATRRSCAISLPSR